MSDTLRALSTQDCTKVSEEDVAAVRAVCEETLAIVVGPYERVDLCWLTTTKSMTKHALLKYCAWLGADIEVRCGLLRVRVVSTAHPGP